jgi:hypothetical protein
MSVTVEDDGTVIVRPTLAKSEDTATEAPSGALLKADATERVGLFVAYAANSPDIAKARDGKRDFASPAVVERGAWNWMAKGAKIGLFHEFSTDEFETVESGIHRGPDWLLKAVDGTEQVVMEGDWLVAIRAKTDAAWNLMKSGLIGGTSPQGRARRGTPSDEALSKLRS